MSFPRPRLPSRRASLMAAILTGALLLPAVAYAAVGGGDPQSPARTPARVAAPQQLPTGKGELIAAVGDIACAPTNPVYTGGEGTPAGCREKTVADLLAGQRLAAFLPLGDLQYEDGRFDEFGQVYDQFFGQYKAITRPVPGNHEYKTPGGRGYYDYFGAAAREVNPFGAGATGSYSYNIGTWHLIAINSVMCSPSVPCNANHALMRWLAADLAQNTAKCTLAYWHHPLWSAGHHGAYAPMVPVWNALLDGGVDLVLTSHDHNYQRFAPLGRATARDNIATEPPVVVPESQGMRAFIVGTGGANNYQFQHDAERPELAGAIQAKYAHESVSLFGALFLRLSDDRYEWSFGQAEPKSVAFTDSGVGTCR